MHGKRRPLVPRDPASTVEPRTQTAHRPIKISAMSDEIKITSEPLAVPVYGGSPRLSRSSVFLWQLRSGRGFAVAKAVPPRM